MNTNSQRAIVTARPFSRLPVVSIVSLALVSLLIAIQPAAAHHAMGGRLPANALEGLISGLAHPIIGLDHFAFVVAIGLLAANQSRGIFLPIAFLLTAALGTGIHLLKLDLPFPEIFVSLSVLALGLLLILGRRTALPILMGIAAIAGLFHGYAYGESIVGAETTPTVAYLIGFTLIQLLIALGTKTLAERVLTNATRSSTWLRFSGYAICLIGAIFLTTAIG